MQDWAAPQKPADLAENRLLDAILNKDYPVNSTLPPERDLAQKLGVTRPTLREALQRLSRDGWIEIRHGKPTRVRDYMLEGNLLILKALTDRPEKMPECFIPDLLHVRAAIAPLYTKRAFQMHPQECLALFISLQDLEDTADHFAAEDFAMHLRLATFSENLIYPLLMNNFKGLSLQAGQNYFQSQTSRNRSRAFYLDLLKAAQAGSPEKMEEISRKMMVESIQIWEQFLPKAGKP